MALDGLLVWGWRSHLFHVTNQKDESKNRDDSRKERFNTFQVFEMNILQIEPIGFAVLKHELGDVIFIHDNAPRSGWRTIYITFLKF